MVHQHLNYKLCRLAKGKRWHIEYYAFDPLTGSIARKREYISHIKKQSDRLLTARLLIEQINYKLINGWSPFIPEAEIIKPITIAEAIDKIFKIKTTGAEARTISTYKSRVTKFKAWLQKSALHNKQLHTFTKQMAIAYMDQIRLSGASNRTYNGYLTDMRTFFNAMAEREMIRQNYFREIKFLKLEDKHRNAFTTAELSRLKDYLTEHDKNFLLCCYYCYYAVLRPVEICRLKVEDINLKEGYIRIDTHQSKNDKAQTIPILPELAKLLKELAIDKQPAKNYIVSHGFVPGAKKLRENEISRQFKRVATAIDLPEHTTFYSLKDTIAERLIGAGYDIKFIQRFFRHHDITITDAYMSKFNPVLDIKLIDKFPAF